MYVHSVVCSDDLGEKSDLGRNPNAGTSRERVIY